jgi:monoamine oxidase
MDEHRPDLSFADFLKQCCADNDPAKEWALGYVQGFHAADPKLVSVHSLVKGTRADEAIEGDRGFRMQGGYAALLQVVERQLRDLHISPQLNTTVERILWEKGKGEVIARTAGSVASFVADCVLITLPLGVLQAKPGDAGAVSFVPDLPAIKQNALQHLVMGHVIRVTLCFRERFWKDLHPTHSKKSKTLDKMGFLLSRDPWFPTWWTRMPEDLPIIVGWAPFPSAATLSGKTEAFVVDKALEALARLLKLEKSHLATLLSAAYTHDWQSDPFSRGAYSYVKVGGDTAEHDLGVPVDNTLFFAGEATDVTGHNGTVHGAIASGKRAATEIIKACR